MDFKNFQAFFWPTIKDIESAKKAAEQGLMAAALYFVLSFGFFLSSEHFLAAGLGVLVVTICGYGARRMSRIAAVAGLIFVVPGVWGTATQGQTIATLSMVVISLLFLNAVRGTFLYPRYAKPPQPTVEVLPPEPPADGAAGPREHAGEDQKIGSAEERTKP
jgi:hypothetical protein